MNVEELKLDLRQAHHVNKKKQQYDANECKQINNFNSNFNSISSTMSKMNPATTSAKKLLVNGTSQTEKITLTERVRLKKQQIENEHSFNSADDCKKRDKLELAMKSKQPIEEIDLKNLNNESIASDKIEKKSIQADYSDNNDYSNREDYDLDNENNDNLNKQSYSNEQHKHSLLFPGYVPIAFGYLKQDMRPRYWCLRMITSPWFERVSMLVIIVNCITLGMYQPCNDNPCTSTRCVVLQYLDHVIYVFFAIEMFIKIIAMGFIGKETYMAETWNRLDFFIVIAGTVEYAIVSENLSLSAIRTIRVLRPLRAINRVPSMRILVMLLLDTLPMLGNVLLLCFFVFFIFGIMGVQLWKGVLRNRCFFDYNRTLMGDLLDESFQNVFYKPDYADSFICTEGSGMSTCYDIPPYINNSRVCNGTIDLLRKVSYGIEFNDSSCINWNQYYTKCRASDKNPFKGAISFDNIGYAWVAIFQIISLESWVTIMYFIQDAHSFWNWIYFVFLIIIGSFFMINLCLVVIATQFSETKKRETERMIAERRRFSRSSSTLLSDSGADPGSCWEEFIKFACHLFRKSKRKLARKYFQYKAQKELRNRKLNEAKRFLNEEQFLVCQNPNHNHSSREFSNSIIRYTCEPEQRAELETSLVAKSNGTNELNKHSTSVLTLLSAPKASVECNQADISGSSRDLNYEDNVHNDENNNEILTKDNSANIITSTVYFCNYPDDLDNVLSKESVSNIRQNKNLIQIDLYDSDILSDTNDSLKAKIKTKRSKRSKHKRPSPSQCFCLSCFCCCCKWLPCYKQFESSHMHGLLLNGQKRLQVFVESKLFQRGILFAILINTLSMGVEHHEQPKFLTSIVEYSNLFFTIIFLIEMLMKIFAFGLFEYIKNAFNIFDGAIVAISVYEVFKQLMVIDAGKSSASGVSVLRTFRLLRILKIVRFMPALRRQLMVMLRTIDNVATFFSLLILFIFIFSILGMNLFGCKFCVKLDNGDRMCERKNFDSLLWAIITVFQPYKVLTQEDWNEVLYNGMQKTSSWAALYFIALMTFGNYVLFNLLVAILVEGFSTEDEPKKSIEDRIREDALHAIAEETLGKENNMSKSSSRLSKHDGHRRNSRRSLKNSNNSINSRTSSVRGKKEHIEQVKTPDKEERDALRFNHNSDTNKSSFKSSETPNQIKLPIITHTCPTPAQTPKNASLASLQLTETPKKSKSQTYKKDHINESSAASRHLKRRFSLDSATEMIKLDCKLKQLASKSTHARIFDSNVTHEITVSINSMKASALNELWNVNNTKTQLTTASNQQIDNTLPGKYLSNKEALKSWSTTGSSLTPPPTAAFLRRSKRSNSEKIVRKNRDISDSSLNFKHPTFAKIEPIDNLSLAKNNESRTNKEIESTRGQSRVEDNVEMNKKSADMKQTRINQNEEIIEINCCSKLFKSVTCLKRREEHSLFLLSKENRIRRFCVELTKIKYFDYTILVFIALNCITLAMERPSIPPNSLERKVLTNSNYLFTFIFAIEMVFKIVANGFYIGSTAYLKSGWNKMDGFLVIISLIDVAVTLSAKSSPKIFGILRVFRLLRTLRPLRVISRAPGLKLVVQTLLSSLRPIGNIVLICCTFFIIFGILGVQLFKGKFYHCVGNTSNVKTKDDCLKIPNNQWINSQYNFDNLGQALMTLFVLSSKDGWVQIMYTGIDAVEIDVQPIENYNEWMLVYFISFILLVGFFVLNMFVGVVIENFHKCRAEQEREEKAKRAAKRAKKFEDKRIKMKEIPYYVNYSKLRRLLHEICSSKYFDLVIAGVIGLNVVSMSLEFYMMPPILDEILDILNLIFTFIFLCEAIMRLIALGFFRYFKEKWNQLDILIVILSIIGILFDKLSTKSAIPINPTIIRVMRVLRIARVLKLLKMAKGIRSLLDTVMQALPQVGNLGLLFFLLFFIFAILGVELFGRLNCEGLKSACDGLSKHAHFHNFGMAFLTLFRIATGDNWNGIMKDTLKDNVLCYDDANPDGPHPSVCLASVIAPIYFVVFVLMAQFVLVNVVVAVLMKHLDDSNKMMADDAELDEEIEKQLENEAKNNVNDEFHLKMTDDFESEIGRPWSKQSSLPKNFIYSNKSTVVGNDSVNEIKLHSTQENKSTYSSSGKSYNDECLKETESTNSISKLSDSDLTRTKRQTASKTNEGDSISGIMKKRSVKQQHVCSNINHHSNTSNQIDRSTPVVTFKSHYSPKTSVKIKVIDETDTDYDN